MVKIQHERLIKLGQIMRSVSKDKIRMDVILNKPTCGSAGCALGQCSVNKTFQDWGVKPILINNGWITDVGISYEGTKYNPRNFEKIGAKIFGITEDEAYKLFKPSYSNDEKEDFLNRFRSFMKSKNLHM